MNYTVVAKLHIYPNAEDARIMLDTMHSYCDACNYISEYIYDSKDLSQASVNKQLYYSIREKFGLSAQVSQSAIKTVIASYKTCKSNNQPWSLCEYKHAMCDLLWNRDYSIKKGNILSVWTKEGRKLMPYKTNGMDKYFDGSWSFGTAKLVFKHGKWFLHIPCSKDIDDANLSDVANVVGIDRGINFVVATYDSRHKSGFVSGAQIKQKRAHYVELRKQLQMRKTPSARRRLKSVGQRENRWMQDVNHCISKALVENNPKNTLFVLEDLTGIRGATERIRTKHRAVIVSWSYYGLEQKLVYKAQAKGSSVIKVDPRYTSQTCPVCGHVEASNRSKKTHTFCCKNCGYTSNDDRIGAMNLYRMGIDYISSRAAAGSSQVPDTVESQHI